MKADDLQLNELVTFAPGNVNLQGRRLVLHSIHAFANFRKDVLEMLGGEQARRLFTRFGYFWGQADAAAMKRIFVWDDQEELLRAGFRLLSLEGIATPEVKVLNLDGANSRLQMKVMWRESGETEEHLIESGWSDTPICWKLVGYASGYASYCLGTNVYFVERKCVAKGDTACLVEGRDLESWNGEITDALPFFQADDIKGNVTRLTRKLKKKMDELARQREQLVFFDRDSARPFVKGRSKALEQVFFLAHRVAQFDSSVLVTGETGVGKEVIARYIYANSNRSDGSFLPINCGALPESILESELFGHRRGAFTGADRDRVGVFEQAARGTIFLDEIGDISPAMQLRILRVIQEREIKRLGESKPRRIDVRILAATHVDLDAAVKEGKFREDLLYRLRVIEIRIPPLRERREDILPLARHIVEKLAGRLDIPELRFDPRCLDLMQAYAWPGNVREMENAIERAAVMSCDAVIRQEDLPAQVLENLDARGFPAGPLTRTLAEVELEYIRAVLDAAGDNRTKAAKVLGIGSTTLWRKLKK